MAASESAQKHLNYIDGEWRSSQGEWLDDTNPADTRKVLGTFPRSTPDDVAAAIGAAQAAWPKWRKLPMPERAGFLRKAADLLEQRLADVGAALTQEEGKTLAEGKGETARGVSILRYYAAEGMQPIGEVYPSAADTFLYTTRVPIGPVGLITPWNFPVAIPLWKLAPALIYGNTVVLKPAELTPLTAWHIADVFREAGLPPGVLNVVFGRGSVIGDAIMSDRRIAGVSFTGSTAIGTQVYDRVTGRGAKCQCEMGGKNPIIVLPDADIDLAVKLTLQGAMLSAGEKCTATSRAIVVGDARRFTEALAAAAKSAKVGDPMLPDTFMGPLISAQQKQTVLDYIEIGKGEGARLLTGGQALEDGAYAHGHFVAPTVFDRMTPEMRISVEEIFGPVVGVIEVKTPEEALQVANGVEYGLSAAVVTSDLDRAQQFIDEIDAGIVHVNSQTAGAEPQVPFGGVKASSTHSREQGKYAIDFYTHVKTVYYDRAKRF
ncbi:MAG TPA: aldehyde dehydrogenase family protein [Limnochordia bacterium]|nr:aldehyde dehydrogenase family protein [Limnochordia bacterium]